MAHPLVVVRTQHESGRSTGTRRCPRHTMAMESNAHKQICSVLAPDLRLLLSLQRANVGRRELTHVSVNTCVSVLIQRRAPTRHAEARTVDCL